ncbi:MAG: glycosyltransferase family 9 protein [Syntrophobacteraceae bacterium]
MAEFKMNGPRKRSYPSVMERFHALKRRLAHALSRIVIELAPLWKTNSTSLDTGAGVKGSKTLVIMLTHLGDVVLHLFILDSLGSSRAFGDFDILVKPPIDQLIRCHPCVQRVMTLSCPWMGAGAWHKGLAHWLRLLPRLRRNRYNRVIVTHPHELSSLTALLTGAPTTIGLAFRGDRFLDIPIPVELERSGHETEACKELLGRLDVQPEDPCGRIPVDGNDFQRGKALVENSRRHGPELETGTIAIHPGSGGKSKNWPWESFAEVVDELLRHGLRVVLLGDRKERVSCASIESRCAPSPNVRNLCGRLNIGELTGAISASDLYLGNDSGPSHIAGALGVRTYVIFGPASDPVRWTPVGPRVNVIHMNEDQFHSVDSVRRVLDAMGFGSKTDGSEERLL